MQTPIKSFTKRFKYYNNHIRKNLSGRLQNLRAQATNQKRDLWVQITTQEVVEKAVNTGLQTFVRCEDTLPSNFNALQQQNQVQIFDVLKESDLKLHLDVTKSINGCQPIIKLKDSAENQKQTLPENLDAITSPEELVGFCFTEFSEEHIKYISQVQKELFLILKLSDWKIIPVENVIAWVNELRKQSNFPIYPAIESVEEAKVMFNILEKGTEGVLLNTNDPQQVEDVWQYLQQRCSQNILNMSVAVVRSVQEVELCDRVCVDVCSIMVPGQGMLVGCFSRGLFLIHSECEESGFISSRPFRVNAGAVSCYILCPDGRTQYLSELRCGSQVVISDYNGNQTQATVARSKIEKRPMVIVEAVTSSRDTIYVVLQNAETVKLVGPQQIENSTQWRTISVTQISEGDEVFVHCVKGARHTGIIVDEAIIEK